MIPLRLLPFVLAFALSAVSAAQEPPRVVVSLWPYASLVEQLAGELATVEVLLPAGASPHTFEPTPSMALDLVQADLVVLNGVVDSWIEDLLEADREGVTTLEVLEVVDFEPIEGEEGVNPHIWLDPIVATEFVEVVAVELAGLRPQWREEYLAGARALIADLEALHMRLEGEMAAVRGAPFIPYHDAWPYFARRYSLDLLFEIEPFPGREPGPRYLAEAVAAIRESGARTIFSEAGLGDRPARVLAQEAGVGLATLDPLGVNRESYQQLLLSNAARIIEGLEPGP